MNNELNIGDKVDYDAGAGTDRWEVLGVEGDTVYLTNAYGATTSANISDAISM